MARSKLRTPAICVAIAAAMGGAWHWRTRSLPFDPAVWADVRHEAMDSNNPRQRMADRLVADGTLIGLDRRAVVAMLGEPKDENGDDRGPARIEYHLGAERGFISMDGEELTIEFDDAGRVTRCFVRGT